MLSRLQFQCGSLRRFPTMFLLLLLKHGLSNYSAAASGAVSLRGRAFLGAHCRAHLCHCPGAKVSSSGGQDGEGTGRAVLGFPGAGAQAA